MRQEPTSAKSNLNLVLRDSIVLFVIWLLSGALISLANKDDYTILWTYVVFPLIPIYLYFAGDVIPKLIKTGKSFWHYFLRLILTGTAVEIVVLLIHSVIFGDRRIGLYFGLYIMFLGPLVAIVAPATWLVYQNRQSIKKLKADLGQTSADLGFLRSQINPHFLFNALNTLYGTALQEQAVRTSEGIQKLGDMMRFMLQENMQDKIALSREIDYLNNYVDLQKLRVQTSPDILIDVNIEDQHNYLLIAPMLLIPFVENAFKHGISLQEPSYIKISLHTEDNCLYFDVCNSTHAKRESDPERDSHGIGLENVRQRLILGYTDNHELVIHESAKEFFVHLVINLTTEIAIIE